MLLATPNTVFALVEAALLKGFLSGAFCPPFALGSVPALPAIFSAIVSAIFPAIVPEIFPTAADSLAAEDALDSACAAASVAANPPISVCPELVCANELIGSAETLFEMASRVRFTMTLPTHFRGLVVIHCTPLARGYAASAKPRSLPKRWD